MFVVVDTTKTLLRSIQQRNGYFIKILKEKFKYMNKTDVISKVAESTGVSKKNTEVIVNEVFQTIIDSVANGDKVQIAGFGIFEKHHLEERQGHDPRDKTPITILAKDVPKFRPSKAFKDVVAK